VKFGGNKDNVSVMLGDPKKAISIFSLPIAIALLMQHSNNLADTLWVTALGAESMAAMGMVYPMYSVLIGVGNGLGIGVSAAIARSIGRGDSEYANKVATQSFFIALAFSLAMAPILLLTAEPVLRLISGGVDVTEAMAFSMPLYASVLVIILSGIMSGILRGEGAVRKSMYIQVIGAVANIILDPVLIYAFDMGIAGAAWATVISFSLSIVVGLYWYLVKKDMFLRMRLSHLRFNRECSRDILSVGLPQSLEFCLMSLFNIGYNICVIAVGSYGAMAVYTIAWRIINMIFIIPQAFGGAIISACSAEYGMRRYDMIRVAYGYAVKRSMLYLSIMSIMAIALADPIASVFSYAPDMQGLHGELVMMLRVQAIMLPVMSLIFVGSSLLQSLNRSKTAVVSSVIRNMLITVAFVFSTAVFGTLYSLAWSMVVCEIAGGALMGVWALYALKDSARRDGRLDQLV